MCMYVCAMYNMRLCVKYFRSMICDVIVMECASVYIARCVSFCVCVCFSAVCEL